MDAFENAAADSSATDGVQWDPVYLHACRETAVVLILLAVFCVWSVGVSYLLGYESRAEIAAGEPDLAVATILGMPAWVFWGVLLPWLAVDAIAIWFCFLFMKDDDLGMEAQGESPIDGGDASLQRGACR